VNILQYLHDQARTLTGERRQRALPRRSAKPAIGARIILVDGGMRLTVQAGLSDALWIWLLDAGWRVETFRPDRRHYREISRAQVARVMGCAPAMRERLLDQGDRLGKQADLGFPASRRTASGAHDFEGDYFRRKADMSIAAPSGQTK
jgi:hypothetical protein